MFPADPHSAFGSDDKTTKWIIDLRPGATFTDTLMLERGGRVPFSAMWPVSQNDSEEPVPNLKAQESSPLVHRELGGYK